MSAKSFIKTVKGARRGVSLAKSLHYRLAAVLSMLVLLLCGSAFFVWWLEKGFKGSYFDSLWTIMFTLIGQGEFASYPHTFSGKIIVFLISIFGVAILGVVFAEVLQRIINSKIRQILGEMMGINTCKFEGHVLLCGWNERGHHIIHELTASGTQAALIAKERPENLSSDVFFVQGNPSERETLLRGGIQKAHSAVILSDPNFGEDDSHSILTALAVEDTAPDVYTVMELHNPDNERYAKYAHVDDILYSDSLIANITAMCTQNEGISAFIRDILSAADDGHSFAAFDVPEEYRGKTISDMFNYLKTEGGLPVGVLTPPKSSSGHVPASEWVSQVNPPESMVITLPMKVVCIVKDSYSNTKGS
ncbi:MAG: potassium channel protein [Synergistaceae bacterium]|nr:potassium channel protein [Synergistaceae bacterium]